MARKDYEIGYGRPPRHAQFRKGQSGNPKGRPKKLDSSKDARERVLNQRITVTQNGKPDIMTGWEALYQSIYAKALKGDMKAAALLLKNASDNENMPPSLDELMANEVRDDDTISRYLAREGWSRSLDVAKGDNANLAGENDVVEDETVEGGGDE